MYLYLVKAVAIASPFRDFLIPFSNSIFDQDYNTDHLSYLY